MVKKKSSFRGKTKRDAARQGESKYGYINYPDGVNKYAPEAGATVNLDILPYIITDDNHPDKSEKDGIALKGSQWYKRPILVHGNVGADNESVLCLKSFGKKCPICEYRDMRMKEGAEKDETDAMRPKKRDLYIVIPHDSKEHKKEIHIADISAFNFQALLNKEIDEDESFEDFPDLEVGHTLKVRFDEEVFNNNKFAKASRIDFKTRKKPYDLKMLKKVPNLDKVLKELSYQELEAKFKEEAEEEKPKRTKRDKSSKSEKKEETKKPKKMKCPNGLKFGKDVDSKKVCKKCKIWDKCTEYANGNDDLPF